MTRHYRHGHHHHHVSWFAVMACWWLLITVVMSTDEQHDETETTCLDPQQQHHVVPDCRDENEEKCQDWALAGKCELEETKRYMKTNCRKSCPHVCQDGSIDVGEEQEAPNEDTRFLVATSLEYLYTQVHGSHNDEKFKPVVRAKCKNLHTSCSYWANLGECQANPKYMQENCALACQSCEYLDVGLRCPWDPNNITAALAPGDLNQLFQRLTTDPEFQTMYHPSILLQPPDGPWVVTLDDFVTEAECEALIQAGKELGYERSMGGAPETGELGEYRSQVSEYRTSYQTWCQGECYETQVAKNISARIEAVTGIGDVYSEFLQLLKYDENQYYKVHHDYIPTHARRPMGPRILTVFLYLNEPEQGGETRFPNLAGGLTVQPKRGRALLWPSVLNDRPMEQDPRTEHEALPVLKGQKFGANAWLHMGDFKAAFARDCHYQ